MFKKSRNIDVKDSTLVVNVDTPKSSRTSSDPDHRAAFTIMVLY